MATNEYFYVQDAKQKGPVSLKELMDLGLPETTLIWYADLSSWTPLAKFPDLFESIRPKTPPPLDADTMWAKCWGLTEEKSFDAAIESWLIYISLFPESAVAAYNLGYCYGKIKDSRNEVKFRTQAANKAQSAASKIEFLITLSGVHEKLKEWDLARLYLARAISWYSNCTEETKRNELECDGEALEWRLARLSLECFDFANVARFFLWKSQKDFLVRHMWFNQIEDVPVDGSLLRFQIQDAIDAASVTQSKEEGVSSGYYVFREKMEYNNGDIADFRTASIRHRDSLSSAFHNLGINNLLRGDAKGAFSCLYLSLEIKKSYQSFFTLYALLAEQRENVNLKVLHDWLFGGYAKEVRQDYKYLEKSVKPLVGGSYKTGLYKSLLDSFDVKVDEEHSSRHFAIDFTKTEGKHIRGIKLFYAECPYVGTYNQEPIYWTFDQLPVARRSGLEDVGIHPSLSLLQLETRLSYEVMLGKPAPKKPEYSPPGHAGAAFLSKDSKKQNELDDMAWDDEKNRATNQAFLDRVGSLMKHRSPFSTLFPFKRGFYGPYTTSPPADLSDISEQLSRSLAKRDFLLFIDTETTGLPKSRDGDLSDFDNWPRLVQVAWILTDLSGKILSKRNFIVCPDGFKIPEKSTAVHGITDDEARKSGVQIDFVLEKLQADLTKTLFVVGHNISFDSKVLAVEFLRAGRTNMMSLLPHICTMKTTIDFCKIPGTYGYKWPKLDDLHFKLFDAYVENAHDAMVDTMATMRCFFELIELGLVPWKRSDIE